MLHFSADEFDARRDRLLAVMARPWPRRHAALRAGEHVLADRLRHVRLLLLPVARCVARRRAHGPAHPLGRSAAGAAHLDPRPISASGPTARMRPRPAAPRHGPRPRRRAAAASASSSTRYGLTHANGRKLEAAFVGFDLVDASDIVTRLRAVKSPAEIAYVREAARLSDARRCRRRCARVAAGADEGDILAAQHRRDLRRQAATIPANEFIIGSGRDALLCRYKSRPPQARRTRPDHARIRRRLPPLPRGAHAHDHGRRRDAAPCRASRRRARGPARLRGRDAAGPHRRRRLRCPCPGDRRPRPRRRIAWPPAAIRSAPSSRRPGWTGRCSTTAMTGCSSRAW